MNLRTGKSVLGACGELLGGKELIKSHECLHESIIANQFKKFHGTKQNGTKSRTEKRRLFANSEQQCEPLPGSSAF
jgi:hypothetical protein